MNTHRPHVKEGVGYVHGAKHNERVFINGKECVEFVKEGSHRNKHTKKRTTNTFSYASNTHDFAHNAITISYYDFDASYVLMKNKNGRVIAKYVGSRNKKSKTCVWVPKSLVTNVKGPKQVWVPKNKT